jgi:hypothetical protein
MTRFFSFLIAAIFLVSATVEIASFAIDHKSWFQETVSILLDRFTPPPTSPSPVPPDQMQQEHQQQRARQACEAACPATAPVNASRCEDIEQIGKKILCHIKPARTDAACRRECEQKSKQPAPGNWLGRDSKGKMAGASIQTEAPAGVW